MTNKMINEFEGKVSDQSLLATGAGIGLFSAGLAGLFLSSGVYVPGAIFIGAGMIAAGTHFYNKNKVN